LPQSNHSFGASLSWTSYFTDLATPVPVTNNKRVVNFFMKDGLEIT